MDPFGMFKPLWDALPKAWGLWQVHRDPVRGQARRFLEAFEAYGVRRQQIARLLPESLQISSLAMSKPEKLMAHISPALLDWAADYLVLSRAWFDGVDSQPHVLVDGYKNASIYQQWMKERMALAPGVDRYIMVWRSDAGPIHSGSVGPLCIVYTEVSDGLDGGELARCWLFSREWPSGHPPCAETMLDLVAVAKALGVVVIGRVQPLRALKELEAGRLFAPQVSASAGALWYPEEAVIQALKA